VLTSSADYVLSDLAYRIRGSKLERLLFAIGIRNEVAAAVERVEYRSNRGVVTVPVKGYEIKFDTKSKQSYCSLRHLSRTEKPLLDDFVDELQISDVVFDVGAHLGLYSKTAATVGVESIVAFELLPANAARLSETMPTDVTVVNQGVAAEVSEQSIEGADDSAGEVTASLSSRGGNGSIPVTSLDAFVRDHHVRPTVMKIDVEGAESKVIAGGEETLRECRVVFVEVHDEYSEVNDLLTALGFEVDPIHRRGDQTFLKATR
jgi:FkbM family methyltransferase